jgi:hypothetical protein
MKESSYLGGRLPRTALIPFGLAIVVGFVGPTSVTAARAGDAMEERVQRIVRAQTAYEAGKGYEELFRLGGPHALRVLKASPHRGIALRAAWEEIRTRIPRDKDAVALRIDSARMQRFLGFVEGRLALPIPGWWEDTLLEARAYGPSNIFFPPREIIVYQKTDIDLLSAPGTSVRKKNGEVLLSNGKQAVTIQASVLHEDRGRTARYLTPLIDKECCYLAIHADRASPYSLLCVGRKKGNIRWSSDVWAAGGLVHYIGQGYHRVTLLLDGDALMVWGVGDDSAYIEGFKTEDGTSLFRFSTSY